MKAAGYHRPFQPFAMPERPYDETDDGRRVEAVATADGLRETTTGNRFGEPREVPVTAVS